jgi:primosomal protein N' (replication factor Y)
MASSIARVVVDLSLDKEFDYRVPVSLRETLKIGSRVSVPFGRRQAQGYVVGLADASSVVRLRDVEAVLDEAPLITEPILDLARWMADYYCAPVEAAIRTVLPGAVRRRKARFKQQLLVSVRENDTADSLSGLTDKQAAVLGRLRESGAMFLSEIMRECGVTAHPVRALEKKGLVEVNPGTLHRDPLANRNILPTEPLALMPEQAAALDMIRAACDSGPPRPVLLYGVTGSGKTEVYLQAIAHVLGKGQGAIVLVPEIALTPQTVRRFAGRFGDRIAVLHSRLSDGERHDEWHRIRAGRASIVIGPRSAVFAPVENLGLIVVDEEHEPSYKQEEAPRYHARDVAVMRGHRVGCPVLLGSATPSLETWQNVLAGKYQLAELPRRADNRTMPFVRVIDMRIEAERAGRPSIFSQELLAGIQNRLERGEQTMLFLNRRGYSTALLCAKCGYVAACPHCSVAFTYHRATERLCCHICGGEQRVPDRCPECRDPGFKYAGIGTQRVEAALVKCFPHARIQRMDADATARKDAHDRILGAFRSGKIDILIGTQMIAKGLHFPNVTLVGVINADLSLHMPDFRAGERTFQLLAQVAGRAGRGDVAGEVMVQTYTPHNASVQAARRNDFKGFCDQELDARRELGYPPFRHLACITFKGKSEERVSRACDGVCKRIRSVAGRGMVVSDGAPAPLAKAKGLFRHQIMLRALSCRAITHAVRAALQGIRMPADVTCTVDIDAVNLL